MKKCLLLLIALTFAPLSFAEGLAWNQHVGPFAEFNAGTNFYYLGVINSEGKVMGSGTNGASLGATLGYNYTPNFGLEGGVLAALVKVNEGNQVYAPYLSTRFTMPLGSQLSLLAKLGLMAPFVPQDGGIIMPFTGIGASYALSQKVDLGLQYQGAVYGIVGAGTLGLSLTYHF